MRVLRYTLTMSLFLCAVVICVVTLIKAPLETGEPNLLSDSGYIKVNAVAKEETTKEETTTAAPVVPDTEAPIFVTGSVVSVKLGAKTVPGPMICIDNVDNTVKLTIEGTYDLNKVGSYSLTRVASDKSGNVSRFPFTLNVVEEKEDSEEEVVEPTPTAATKIEDIFSSLKNDNNSIGIDVSKWQGDIDWNKVKSAGIEFAMIRLGVQDGFEGEPTLDSHFLQNYNNAKAAGLNVGVYYYSYAKTVDEARQQAKFVVKTLKENNCKLDMPVAYDWESWSRLSSLKISINEFNACAKAFLDTVKSAGYDGMIYSSKYYLEKTLWRLPEDEYPVWLAHYTNTASTGYEGSYKMWQCSCTGVIPGINGAVDVNILYK